MSNDLETIRRLILEHQVTRADFRLVGDRLNDQEALLLLQSERANWIPGQEGDLSEKQNSLIRAIGMLEEGLKNHYAFEEKALPPLMGELLTEALMVEHHDLLEEISGVKAMVANIKLEGLGREEILSRQSSVQEAIDSIRQHKEEHMATEEPILYMLQRALEKRTVLA